MITCKSQTDSVGLCIRRIHSGVLILLSAAHLTEVSVRPIGSRAGGGIIIDIHVLWYCHPDVFVL